MYFRINQLRSDGQNFYVGAGIHLNNALTVIVGPNGVGKTRLLSGLAYLFTKRRNFDKSGFPPVEATTEMDSIASPVRVIAQTFSPFSRFPKERPRPPTLSQYLNPVDEQYCAVGFTRNMGIRGSASKDAVGRIIRKLFTKPEHAAPLSDALVSLGFKPAIDLRFELTSLGRDIDIEAIGINLRKSVDKLLKSIGARGAIASDEIRISREIDSSNDQLANQITKAIENLSAIRIQSDGQSKDRSKYRIDLALDLNSITKNNQLLESLIVLSRVGLIRLSDCYIKSNRAESGKLLSRSRFEEEFSLTEASSGEQQLLSSLFGIAAELENDSLILIDEPELSLHPEWQSRFIDLLLAILEPFKGCHVMVATHSALIAQRAAELKLEVVKLGENSLRLPDRLSHASIDQTLLEVFDVAVKDSMYVSRLILSLVMRAEADPKKLIESRNKLVTLKNQYMKSNNPDSRTVGLLDDALDILVGSNGLTGGE